MKFLNLSALGFALVMVVPSTAIVQKYLGPLGVVLYAPTALIVLMALHDVCQTSEFPRVPKRCVVPCFIILSAFLIVTFQVVYPLANSGRFGPGSDRDEALNIATDRLLHRQYPYYATTYLDNPFTPLPGSLILAIPFTLIGNAAYQNIPWLLVFLSHLSRFLKNTGVAWLVFFTLLVSSPLIMQEYVTGGDLLANSIIVTLTVVWFTSVARTRNHSRMHALTLAVFLGLGLASRPHFALVLPPVLFSLSRSVSVRVFVSYSATIVVTSIIVTLPFWLYDPHGFSPLHVLDKFDSLESTIPLGQLWIPVSSTVFSIWVAIRKDNSEMRGLLRNCTLVLAFPIVLAFALHSIVSGRLEFGLFAFGLSFIFFGIYAFAPIGSAVVGSARSGARLNSGGHKNEHELPISKTPGGAGSL